MNRGEELNTTEEEEEEEEEGKSESYCLAPSARSLSICPSLSLPLSVIHKHTHREPAGVLCDGVTMATHSNMKFAGRLGVSPAASRGELLLAICLP